MCEAKGGNVEILAIASKAYPLGSWEEAIVAADEVIIQVEEKLPPETEADKVILGLPTEYTQDGKIAEPYLANIKSLLEKLSLTPLGFVEIPLAIINFLQKQEGGPQSLILVRIGQKLTVSLVRVGKISNETTLERTENLAFDLEKALTSFPGVEVLPSRILLYNDAEDLEKRRQELMTHPWLTRTSFLHFPKIEIAPPDLDIKAVTIASASEIVPPPQEPVSQEAADFGFVQGRDILQEEKEEKTPPPSPPPQFARPTEPVVSTGRPRVSLPKLTLPPISLPSLPSLASLKARFGPRKASLVVLAVLPLLLLGGGALAASYYYPQAKVNLLLEPQTLQQELEVTLNPKIQSLNEENKEIPALNLEIEEKGNKKAVTTGKKLVGEPAGGDVTIYNKMTNSKTFKKGTILIGPNELKFTLAEEVSIASASENVGSLTFGKQNTKVSASAIGPEGNLGVGQEFQFAEFPTSSYSARNEVAFSGGTSREISVVSRADQEKLLSSASAELGEQAKKDLEGKIGAGEKILDKTLVGTVTQKKFDQEVEAEATQLGLDVAMHFTALGYREDDLLTLLQKIIGGSIPSGFEFKKEETQMEVLNFEKKKDGNFLFKVNFTASLLPKVNQEEIKKNLTGKSLKEAENYLHGLGNLVGYEVKFLRNLPFAKDRLPRLLSNIQIETGSRK